MTLIQPTTRLRLRKTALLLIAMTLAALSSTAHAAVPQLVSYQGLLKDSSGNYLTGTYSMTFKIYSASTGGTALWTETQSSVSANSGKFSVQLGSVTTLDLDFDQDYWLGLTVGADSEMSPRVNLTSVGYAYRAQVAEDVVNGFTQAEHDALDHKNITGVKDNTVLIGKTNFKLDAYSTAVANSLGSMVVDTFSDASGIDSGSSSDYTWRGSSNYDVVLTEGGIDSYVVLAAHANGSDTSTTFTDSSTSAQTITANGNAQIDTAQSEFGSASALFDGSGDYLSIADSNDWDFGTGDFTIDFWHRKYSSANETLFDIGAGGQSGGKGVLMYLTDSNNLQVYINGSQVGAAWVTVSTGVWYHFAVVRNGSTVKVYQDGVEKISGSSSSDITGSTQGVRIGIGSSTGYTSLYVDGWIDEFRVSKGIARWTTGFTPPSTEYASSSGSATVVSNTYTVSSSPSQALVMADDTPNDGSVAYYVSRDDGTTWTACAKETSCDISGQPSGTSLRWKAVISDDAELNAMAVAV